METTMTDLERKAFRSYWNDGLIDLMLGLVVLVVGLSWWQDVPVFGAIFPAACVSMWRPLRARIVAPRMGYVEFSGERELQGRTFRHGLLAFFAGTALFGAMIFVLWNREALPAPREWIAGFPLLLLAIPAALFGLFTDCRRFLAYAAALLGGGVVVALLDRDPHVAMIAVGALITLAGAALLARFVTRHPADGGEAP